MPMLHTATTARTSLVLAATCCGTLLTAAPAPDEARSVRITLHTRALQPGEVVIADVSCRCDLTGYRVRTPGGDVALRPVAVDPPAPRATTTLSALAPAGRAAADSTQTLWQAMFGLDLDLKPGVYALAAVAPGQSNTLQTMDLVVTDKAFPTRRLRVSPRYVEPDPDDVARIRGDAALIDATLRLDTPRAWAGPFVAPSDAPANSNFGLRSVFNGRPRSPHAGVDFAAPAGAPVHAPGDGRVVIAGDLFFTGNTVVIDHGAGLFSFLAHLSRIDVARDDQIVRGAVVGAVGATGRVTGPHLHWSVRLNGARVDPLSLLAATELAAAATGVAAAPASAGDIVSH